MRVILACLFAFVIGNASAASLPAPPTPTPIAAVNLRPPSPTDDSAHGYGVGSTWNYNGIIYTAIDVTPGVAAWQIVLGGYPLPVDSVTDATPFAAYGTHLLKASYAGNGVQVERASDSTTLNIGFSTSGLLNTPALDAFCAGTTCRVMTWYDQSGSAHNATASAFSTAPAIIASNTIGNSRSIVFDTITSIVANGQTTEVLNIPSGFSGALGNSAVLSLTRTALTYAGIEPVQLNGASYDMATYYNQPSAAMILGWTGATVLTANFPFGLTPQITGYTSNTANLLMFNGAKSTTYASISALTQTLALGGYIGPGTTSSLLSSANGFFETGAVLVYTGISNADVANLQASINYNYGLAPQTLDNWLVAGDSITAGTDTTFLQTYTRKAVPLLTKPFNAYNFGAFGVTLATMAANFSTLYTGVYNANAKNNIISIFAGTNDIANGVSAATTYAALLSFCSQAHAVGWKVIVATMLPRGGFTSPEQVQQGLFNSSVRSGWATFADGIADVQANDIMGPQSATSNTALYVDGTHPTDLGYTYIAPIMAAAVNALSK